MSDDSDNGEKEIKFSDLSQDDKLQVLLDALLEITERFETLSETLQETNEKLSNIDLPGRNYSVDRYDS